MRNGLFFLLSATALLQTGGALAASPTTTTLASNANPSRVGQNVTLTATVTGSGTIAGSVNFFEGATTRCAAVTVSAGTATCVVTAPPLGNHDYTASYSGDATHNASTGTLTQVVAKAATTLSVAATPTPSTYGQSVAITATIANGTSPTGTVAFTADSTPISGCGSVAVSAAKATCNTSSLSTAVHTLAASYGGDANNQGSSGSVSHTVEKVSTTTTLAATPNPSTPGQNVSLTVSVTGGANPTGNVTFKAGGSAISGCQNVALDGSRNAQCSTGALPVGNSSLTAVYNGDTNNATSTSNTVTQIVNKYTTTTTLTSDTNPGHAGTPLTLTAIVSGSGGPTGTVAFRNGASAITGCASQTLSSGHVATCVTAFMVGMQNLAADYSGDASNATSTGTLSLDVGKATTTSTLSTACRRTFAQNQPFTLNLAVSGFDPGGSAQFTADLNPLPSCTVALSAGAASCTTTNVLSVGPHDLAANYFGDAQNAASTSNPIHVTVLASNDTIFRGGMETIPANCPTR